MTDRLPKITLAIPRGSEDWEWFAADSDSADPDELHAALNYIVTEPAETRRVDTRRAPRKKLTDGRPKVRR
jgi:hypothetical protein